MNKVPTWNKLNARQIIMKLNSEFMKMTVIDIWRHEALIYEYRKCLINVFIHNYRIIYLMCTICIKMIFQILWLFKLKYEIV